MDGVSWRLLLDGAHPGPHNMAVDQALLDRADRNGERWLRLYAWDPPCLSFGRHEPAARRYDPDRIGKLGVDVVRRPSGGRAVWHSREVTYAVAALRQAYLEIHHLLLDALASLGVIAELAAERQAARLDAGACFNGPAGGELLVASRKVVGSAQVRQGTALLQHGSMLLADEQRVVEQVTRGHPSWESGIEVASPALGSAADRQSLIEAVAATAEGRWGGEWKRDDGIAVSADAARHEARFRSPTWTWCR
jgi:lipoate-protein ligase A